MIRTVRTGIYSAIVNLVPLSSAEDLEPIEPFAPLPTITTSSSSEKLERVGVNGTTMPTCTYMSNPPYSEEARKLKISGSVTAEAVVHSNLAMPSRLERQQAGSGPRSIHYKLSIVLASCSQDFVSSLLTPHERVPVKSQHPPGKVAGTQRS